MKAKESKETVKARARARSMRLVPAVVLPAPDDTASDAAATFDAASGALPAPAGLVDAAAAYLAAARSENTRRAYAADWRSWAAFAAELGAAPLPASPLALVLYVTELAERGRATSSIERALAAISQAHKLSGLATPVNAKVREVMRGIKNARAARGASGQKEARPTSIEDLAAMVATLDAGTLRGLRDRARLLLGFAGAFRRSELAALTVEDLARDPRGLKIRLRRSKTDQEGQGVVKGILFGANADTCPVRAVDAWLKASGITSGPLFREVNARGRVGAGGLSDKSVDRLVQAAAEAAGLGAGYSGHSLRAGLVTEAARRGKGAWQIMRQTGHRSEKMVRKYIRAAEVLDDVNNPLAGIGL